MNLTRTLLRRDLLVAIAASTLLTAASWGQTLTVTPDHADGKYAAGETARWLVEVKDGTSAEADYVVKKGGLTEVAKGKGLLTAGKTEIVAPALTEPGSLLVEDSVTGTGAKAVKELSGAMFSPEKIRPSAARPADFDAFWKTKLDELTAVAPNPKLEAGDSGKPAVDYWKISMDNIRGTHIQGQLARPKQGDKFPALLIVQWAGVYPLQKGWAVDRAAEGWLVLNIEAHDLPIDQPAEFYKGQSEGALKDYPAIGNDDRETSYFLRMYLSCYRAADYLTQRPDWDGKILVVTGGSQGGLQGVVTAALHPKVTGVSVCVPAGCDMTGPDAGRAPGWPMWYWKTQGKDEKKVREASRYYDVVNFAPLVKCPVLVGVGLIDQTCPPAGVYAAFNLLAGPKEIVLLPRANHGDKNGSHANYYKRMGAWMGDLRQGKPAPVLP